MQKNQKVGKLFVISAPSGTGKTTLTKEVIKNLEKEYPISKVKTYTTRAPREGEKNGVDYSFVSLDEFERRVKENFFLETTKYDGHLYGSPASIITDLELGKSFIIITDLDGVKSITHLHNNSTFIWIKPPDLINLKSRLLKRGSLNGNQVEQRLKLAQEELKEAEKPRLFNYVVVNEIFDQTVRELAQLIKKELE